MPSIQPFMLPSFCSRFSFKNLQGRAATADPSLVAVVPQPVPVGESRPIASPGTVPHWSPFCRTPPSLTRPLQTVEEARVLFSEDGYTYLDVRPALELEEVGKVKDSVNIPLYNSVRKFNSETRQKEVVKTENEKFKEQIEKRFPDKGAKILVACSDGRNYSMDALEQLDEMGYTNLVGLKGGYYAWFRVFDNKLNRRRVQGEYSETFTHDGDSCGIHSSGAGFEKVDAIEAWVPPSY
eukprot:jgi/Botrbrau1/19199/Bobra.0077s0102.1